MFRFAASLCVCVATVVLCSCESEKPWETEFAPEPRAATPTLSMAEAKARSRRVSNVSYDLDFELDAERPEFIGHATIQFDLNDASALLTLDFVGGSVHSTHLNGNASNADYNGYFLALPSTALREGPNLLEVAFSHPYSTDGSGLYRFRDPLDERDYLYTDFEPYDANRVFPAFDQPDLKATYATQVTVPREWHVISIVTESTVEDRGATKRWIFPKSTKISTYIYALHAGNYQRWDSLAGDIPLRLFARASLAEYVHPEHWFVPTQQGFEFFQAYFEFPYPFGKYDQIIVPHFNAGAMENVAAVTFSERFLQRGTVTRQNRRSIASVILHEMAHMWFGDLVTMDWWNGLWLNESFATFMATLAMAEATEFTEVQLNAFRSSVRAYRADERDTTHPIELPTPDTAAAFTNFDAITYSKGSATLTQLNHLVGPEAFRRGVSAYLTKHAYKNTTIDDFLNAIAESANQDLSTWAADWLREPGTNGVAVAVECGESRASRLTVLQSAPPAWPTLRTHRTQLGFYSFDGADVDIQLVPVTYTNVRTELPLANLQCPDVVYANHGNWDFVRVELDESAVETLTEHLNDFDAPLTRSMLWQAIYEMVLAQRMTPMSYIDFVINTLAGEADDDVIRQVLGSLQSSWFYVRRLATAEAVQEYGGRIESFLWTALLESEPSSDRQLVLFDNYVQAVKSASELERLAGFLVDDGMPNGLTFDQDRRWNLVQKLVGFGYGDSEKLLATERGRDPSDEGRRHALSVEAARPNEAQQRRLMSMLLNPDPELSVAVARAYAGGLFPEQQTDMKLQLVDHVFENLQHISNNLDPLFFRPITNRLLGSVCDHAYLGRLEQAIGQADTLHPSLRKKLLDLRFDVKRCLAIGQAMASQ